ncbi:plant-specific TFIIB-related protein PTF2-like [Ipomoea triloba]|uniref:plant-specific TFIIB-related protein PTF2-like n=1 Tax=Ipomoea triloba TaxID=35885 RepID=UPI00125DBAA2|nr:plant-specific TFIIB-related protein PTF2-like [Ipomoea triloba]XP_031119450.1 plant-specific TFIIB-related protein PTF2-like [Ipomoea triloba]XP_031119451.1 plant-specific TFIIB-related protein PTF2-like [Ipomoea triloba]XP_031119452.1 plant-specific TFIIB-related protein PTF2-like [Ipomoea triloba]
MEGSRVCKSCGTRGKVVTDHDTGNSVCTSCGVVQDFDNFQAHIGGINGPVGTYVRVGTVGNGSLYSYKETKIYEAQKVIEDLMYKLGFSATKSSEVKHMIEKITEGEYGQGRWFSVLIGACSYIAMRKDLKALPMEEVANLVGCDVFEMGRMIKRVVDFLDLRLPEFDIVNSFEQAIRSCPSFREVSEDMISRMLKQGVFLVQCLVNWFVTTGRRPMPVVAAVLVFVAELNQISIKMGDVASELHVALKTCKLRYKELLERLVKVAQALPWGKDVNTKNIMRNAPSVIQYMELKSMSNRDDKGNGSECAVYDMNYLVGDCLSKENLYGYDVYGTENDSQYFKGENSQALYTEAPERLQLSHESLSMIYSELKNEVSIAKETTENGYTRTGKGREYDILTFTDWWKGESELSRKLLLKQILEKDTGLNATPPSFDRGCLAYERRREKIYAAKLRIQRTMHPSAAAAADDDKKDLSVSDIGKHGKKRKRKMHFDIDWEDFIIETLLLHQVREEEIEKGHYIALLGLHVFNGGS